VQRLSWWLEWPAGPIRVGVAFLVAVAAVAVVLAYPGVLRKADREASGSSALSYADREIAGGNALVDDQLAVYAARGLIPEDATYHVDVSPDYEGDSDLTQGHVAGYYRYFLMPRRPAEDGPWIICYGCDLTAYGAGTEVVWQGDENISIARVRS
jgi:hypothetical protein